VFEEIEKLIEPEIRRFLEKGTRKALDGASKFAVDHLDDPTSIQFRRNFVGFFLEQEGAFHVHALSDDVLEEIDRIAFEIAMYVAGTDEAHARLHETVERISAKHGERALKDVLVELGVTELPPFDEWANASFPAISCLIRSPHFSTWLEGLVREVLEVIGQH